MQRFFRRDGNDALCGEKSFMYGKSVSNQRIEAWWSFLRKSETDWWMKFFKDLRDSGAYSDDDPVQIECLRFCFMRLLQEKIACMGTRLCRISPQRYRTGSSPFSVNMCQTKLWTVDVINYC